jgi:hypothetical protein
METGSLLDDRFTSSLESPCLLHSKSTKILLEDWLWPVAVRHARARSYIGEFESQSQPELLPRNCSSEPWHFAREYICQPAQDTFPFVMSLAVIQGSDVSSWKGILFPRWNTFRERFFCVDLGGSQFSDVLSYSYTCFPVPPRTARTARESNSVSQCQCPCTPRCPMRCVGMCWKKALHPNDNSDGQRQLKSVEWCRICRMMSNDVEWSRMISNDVEW